MIRREQFLPKYPTLTSEQRASLAQAALEYQNGTLPQVEAAPEPWTADTVAKFDEGLVLISTLFRARDFCVAAYGYKQVVKRLNGFRVLFVQLQQTLIKDGYLKEEKPSVPAPVAKRSFPTDPRRVLKQASLVAKVAEAQRYPLGDLQRVAEGVPVTPVPAGVSVLSEQDRPHHLDEYIQFLSPEMKKEASRMSDMYMEFAEQSRKLEQMCENPNSSKQDRAYHANLLCELEDKIKNLWRRIDVDFAKQTGKEVSTEYQDFLDEETRTIYNDNKERALGEYSKLEIDLMSDDNPTKEPARRARIERDKKFLRRDDRQQSDEQKENLLLAASELHDWGFLITPSQIENCKFYGVEIPKEWTELSPEEQKKADAEREAKRQASEQKRNEKRKAERKAAREAREAQEQEELKEAMAPYEKMAEGENLV